MKRFRVIDTGIRGGRYNVAFDQALIELHRAKRIPDTIRFLRFKPTALVGRHQAVSHEIQQDYCTQNGIEIARRVTGGGAIYFDEGQLGWELIFHRRTLGIGDLGALAETICTAAAAGLERLGVAAKFRPRNDIEVDGRKISGTGGFFDGDTLFYQGTLLIDTDPARMAAALNVPQAKLAKRRLGSAEDRVVTLRELLGDAMPDMEAVAGALVEGFRENLAIDAEPGDITGVEEATAERLYGEEIGTDEFVWEIDDPRTTRDVLSATHSGPGGTLNAYLRLEGPGRARIREILLTGDFFVAPPRMVYDLESALRGVPVGDVDNAVNRFFHRNAPGLMILQPRDFRAVIGAALAKL